MTSPDAQREKVRESLERMKREGRRHFNEQLLAFQEESASTDAEMFDVLNDLGLADEARSYRAYLIKLQAFRARRASMTGGAATDSALEEARSFVMAENELASHLRDSTVNNSLPWIGVTDLHNIAQDLLMRGWTKAPADTAQEDGK